MKKGAKRYCLFILFLVVLFAALPAQDSLLVTGKVTAGKNNPLKDVSVSVEGYNISPVITDSSGNFSISVPTGSVWLMIVPLGDYESKRIFLDGRQSLMISLTPDIMKSYNDPVPINHQIISRSDIITSYFDIDLEKNPINDVETFDQLIQGSVPGLWLTHHSGMPGLGAIGFIRGINSMNATNAPLVVVDGMPLEPPGIFQTEIQGNYSNPLSNIDPNDISKLTILKDPTATAIYGAKASNGLILIQTLDPKSTQTSIDISMQRGISLAPSRFIPQLDREQYLLLANEVLSSSNLKEEDFEIAYPGLYTDRNDDAYYRYMHDTNWQKYIFSNGQSSNIYFSMKGGSEIAKYGLSVSYLNQDGVFENSTHDRFNVRFVSYLNLFPRFKMDVTSNLINGNSSLKESAVSKEVSPVLTSLFKAPLMNRYQYDEKGNRLSMIDDTDELGTSNPYALMKNYIGDTKDYRFITSIKGLLDISKTMKMISIVGLNFNTMKEFIFMPNIGMEKYFDGEALNVAQSTNNYLFSFYNDNYLSLNKQFGNIHALNAVTGFRIHTNTLQTDFGRAMNMPENDEYTRLQAGQNDLRVLGGINSRWNWASLYNQINYKFKDKYLLNVSGSADFSTRYGAQSETSVRISNLPIGLFYSLGAGWRLSQESFLREVKGLENILLRASYGKTGNDDIGNVNALDYYYLTRYRETSGLIPGSAANKSLKYEEFYQFNTGIDVSFWGGRTRLTVDYYISKSSDILVYEPLESYMGYSFLPANSGMLNNSGWEFAFNQRLIDGHQFSWDFSTNLSLISNQVIRVPENESITQFVGGEMITRNGESVNCFYGYEFNGVYSTQQDAQEVNLVNSKGIPYGAGDAIFQDISGPEGIPDGIINDYDKVVLGSPIPDFFGGISNRFIYRRWELSMMIQFVYGNEVFNYVRYMNERMVDLSNQSKNVLNRWQYDGDETNVPRALWNDPIGNSVFSSRWIEDGSYLRLKHLKLSYTIPEGFFKFQNASFYISGTNLLTLHKYLGYDPEFSYSYDPMMQGIDYGLMPQFRKFLIGVKVGL
ncbi:MAG: SusC/RagA family TonB-linked outer membrane protein [Bacteroidales bacterium]